MAKNLIVGIIFIFGRIVYTLFDTGASRSFISAGFVNVYEIATELLDELVNFATLLGRSLVIEQVSLVN